MLLTVAIARRGGHGRLGRGRRGLGRGDARAGTDDAPSTAATKDLRLIVRDRSQLLALIAMPVIFIGVQVFGAAGWGWSTANLGRISCLAYSLALYMGTIGPLTHMQAERRAFWILRTVPVPLSQPARREGARLGGHRRRHRSEVFAVLSLSVPYVGRRTARGGTAGHRGGRRDELHRRRDGQRRRGSVRRDQHRRGAVDDLRVPVRRRAVQPRAGRGRRDRVAGLLLYGFAGWTYWLAGVEQAGFCLDAEVVRKRRLRASDGATMVILYAVGGRALLDRDEERRGCGQGHGPGDADRDDRAAGVDSVHWAGGVDHTSLRRPARGRRGWAASLTIGAGAGALGAGVIRAVAGAGEGAATGFIAVLVEEIVLRGIVQRALPVPPLAAAAITVIVGVVSAQVTGSAFTLGAAAVVALVISHMCGAFVYALTGRVAASLAGTRFRRRCCGFHLATVSLTMITMRSSLSPAHLLPLATSRLRAMRLLVVAGLGTAALASCGVDQTGLGSMSFLPHDASAGGVTGNPGSAGASGTTGGVATGLGGTGGGSTAGVGGTDATAGTGGGAVAGTTGTAGTMGSAGTTGVAGTTGTAGTTGVAGTTGTPGRWVPRGRPASPGPRAAAGTTGVAGTTGAAGTTGVAGTTGLAGAGGIGGRGGTGGTVAAAGPGAARPARR